jgi:hypothetical protein
MLDPAQWFWNCRKCKYWFWVEVEVQSPTNSQAGGGTGGKGVVILRMPMLDYSGTTTGSPTVTTDGGTDTVIIFNDSGSYTG